MRVYPHTIVNDDGDDEVEEDEQQGQPDQPGCGVSRTHASAYHNASKSVTKDKLV